VEEIVISAGKEHWFDPCSIGSAFCFWGNVGGPPAFGATQYVGEFAPGYSPPFAAPPPPPPAPPIEEVVIRAPAPLPPPPVPISGEYIPAGGWPTGGEFSPSRAPSKEGSLPHFGPSLGRRRPPPKLPKLLRVPKTTLKQFGRDLPQWVAGRWLLRVASAAAALTAAEIAAAAAALLVPSSTAEAMLDESAHGHRLPRSDARPPGAPRLQPVSRPPTFLDPGPFNFPGGLQPGGATETPIDVVTVSTPTIRPQSPTAPRGGSATTPRTSQPTSPVTSSPWEPFGPFSVPFSNPFAQPLTSPFVGPQTGSGTSTGTQTRPRNPTKDTPLTETQTQGLPFVPTVTPTPVTYQEPQRPDNCPPCPPSRQRKPQSGKSKPRKERTECRRGIYIQSKKGISYHPKEKFPCP